MATFTISDSSTVLVNPGGTGEGPDGVRLQCAVSGTNSVVLKKNINPPGVAASLVDVAYLNASLVAQSAGTAITSSGLAYVSAADAAYDLYAVNTWTSGSVVITTAPAVIGGGASDVAAADITSGTFGANSGDVGTYLFPGSVTTATSQTITNGSLIFTGAGRLQPISNGRLAVGNSTNAGFSGMNYGPSASAASRFDIQKAVTAIPNNTATAVLTVTVPNAAHSAALRVRLVGSLGAGGAVGANEATGHIGYDFSIARRAGVATVVTASTAYGSATSAVAGAATITVTAAASSITGGTGATQTFTVNITIARGSGSSDNHTAFVYADLLNANASGVTIA